MFQFPPSTPDARQKRHDVSNFAASTTPAGAPLPLPSGPSTTPAGPPPSSVFGSPHYQSSVPFPTNSALDSNVLGSSPQGLPGSPDRSEDDYDAMEEDNEFNIPGGRSVQRGDPRDIPYLAKSFGQTLAQLEEGDEVVLQTEHLLKTLHHSSRVASVSSRELELATVATTTDLIEVWEAQHPAQSGLASIGPGSDAPLIAKAAFLAKLQFLLHHPPARTDVSGPLRSSARTTQLQPLPGLLVAWLSNSHKPYPQDVEDLLDSHHDPCEDVKYWDTIFACTVRGQLHDTLALLQEANFEYAITALDDGAAKPGYHGRQLGNVQRVIGRTIQLIDACPGAQNADWNTKNAEWAIFRKKVHQAIADLETFAEGNASETGYDEPLQAEHFGMSSIRHDGLSMYGLSQRATSKVPWSIYQNLKALYGVLLGTSSEVVASSADWVEATIGLTVWWDGEDERSKQLTVHRRSLNKSQSSPQSDSDSAASYRKRLAAAFHIVIYQNDDAELQVNPRNSVEVALACIFLNDIEGLIGILRGLSSTVGAAVTEIGGMGGWLGAALTSQKLPGGLDQSDLMVLSYAQQDRGLKRDDILIYYANLLARRPSFRNTQTKIARDGWQLATQVLCRLTNAETSKEQIVNVLGRVDVKEADRVEQVLTTCNQLGLLEIGRQTAEKYADFLTETTAEYGNQLYYYCRAHNVQKIRGVTNMLVSLCVVQSMAYPPFSQHDPIMKALLTSPMQTVARLDRVDHVAAGLMSTYFSGYATIRKIYDLRDQGLLKLDVDVEQLRPIGRKKAAAAALAAAIVSASDSIHGGLYDDTIDSVVPVDVLLSLLGETLVFLNQPRRILAASQVMAILKAVEDLSTAPAHVFAQCEECLKSTLTQSQGFEVPSPQTLMKKSVSSLSASSYFSLIDSTMLKSNAGSNTSSGVLVNHEIQRGWDWRKGMKEHASGEDILKVLRLGLATEISRAWTAGD